jgi:hypothetical protein
MRRQAERDSLRDSGGGKEMSNNIGVSLGNFSLFLHTEDEKSVSPVRNE